MKKALSVLIALALLIGTCSPVLSAFAKSEPVVATKSAVNQSSGKLADMLPEKPIKHELKKLDESQKNEKSKALWEIVTGPFSSDHPYKDDTYHRWIYGNTDPNVTYIEVTFSAETKTEEYWDSIGIYDDEDFLVGEFSGDQLAGKTITVLGKGFTLVFYSDESNSEYGFDVTAITPGTNSSLSGTCGANLTWLFNIATGALDISGTGAMDEYDAFPWDSFRSHILSVSIGAGVTSLSDFSFADCYFLTEIKLGADLETIGEYAFAYCYGLTSVVIPNKVAIIGAGAFENCEYLASVTLGSGIEKIEDFAFAWCYELTAVIIPNSVRSIGAYAFCETGISTVSIGNNVQSIGEYAFAGCYLLEAVVLPNNLEELYEGAFIACELLLTVSIPEGVTYIGPFAFALCYSLQEILVDNNNENFFSQDGILFDVTGTKLIQYPLGKAGYEDGYEDGYGEYYFIPYGVEIIGEGAFAGCGFYWIGIPESVTAIEEAAFAECGGLDYIYIPDSVLTIGESAFAGCLGVSEVYIGYRVTNIGDGAFYGCENLYAAYFYGNAPTIGMEVFGMCPNYFEIYYIEGKLGFEDWYEYSVYAMDGWIDIFGDGEWTGDGLLVKVKGSKLYKKIQLQLDYYSIVGDVDHVEWKSDNPKVVIDEETGLITNLRTGARSANITLTITDTNGTPYSQTVKVVFYKYKWQLKKLQSQAVVSDRYSQRNLSVEEFEKIDQNEANDSLDIMQTVLDLVSGIFAVLQRLVFG